MSKYNTKIEYFEKKVVIEDKVEGGVF